MKDELIELKITNLVNSIVSENGLYWENLIITDEKEHVVYLNELAQNLISKTSDNTEIFMEDIFEINLVEAIRQCAVIEDYVYIVLNGNHHVCSLIEVDLDGDKGLYAFGVKCLKSLDDMLHEIHRINLANQELKEAINKSFDGIYITNHHGTTVLVNDAHARISGLNKERLLNQRIDKMVEKGIFSGFITNTVISERKPITILQEVSDSQKNLLITGNPVCNEAGKIIKVVTNVRDVTELITLQKELKTTKAIVEKYRSELFEDANIRKMIIEKGSKFEKVMILANRVAPKDSTVLILGETGTGKEVVARAIYSNSGRNEKNYLKINCGAIPSNLLESELFGYVKGAFTGADPNGKLGMFEVANNGTLFLDEIGELPLHLQASLLRVLQDGEITRIGDTKSRKVNVRIIAATNRNLEDMIKEGKFRSDLYYRLNVVSISIPPLRERKDEIPGLVEETIRRLNEKYNEKKVVTDAFMETLMEKEWPGNIRELENYVEKYFVIQDDDIIDAPYMNKSAEIKDAQDILNEDKLIPMKEALEEVERRQIEKAMRIGKSTYKAAELLGMSQSTFFRRYKKLIIENMEDY